MLARRFGIVVVAGVALAACSSSSGGRAVVSPTPPSPAEVKAKFEKVVKEDPANKYGWYNLGFIAQDEDHDSETAAADYTKAIALDPQFEAALYNLGDIRLHAGKYSSAIALLTRAVAITPGDAKAHLDLGRALRELHTVAGDKRSQAELHEAAERDPALETTTTR